MMQKLGIIAGNGDLPLEIANLHIAAGGECIVASLDHEFKHDSVPSKSFSIGSVGGILEYFTENAIEDIIIIGGINRPDLASLRVDFSGSVLVAKIFKEKILGDDNVLKVVSNYIESKGFKVISPREILKQGSCEIEISSKHKPSKQDIADIEIGKDVIKSLGALDVGQSVIVCDGYVVGIEAAEGTDNLIQRCELLRKKKNGGVLIKMSKSAQDARLDIPVIGPETIFFLAKHGFAGVAIEKRGVIIIKPEETLVLLDEHGLFLELI